MSKPLVFIQPLASFDVGVLPADCREQGTQAFKNAVTAHYVDMYGSPGNDVTVLIGDERLIILKLPAGQNPLGVCVDLCKQGRFLEAIPLMEALDKENANHAQLLYNLGLAYSETGQFPEAVIRLKRAVAANPSHAQAWTAIAVAYQQMKQPQKALEAAQRAVEVDPSEGHARRNLGAVLLELGREAEAEEHLARSVQLLPDDPRALLGLANARERLAERGDDSKRSDELYRQVIQRWPDSELAEVARTRLTETAHRALRGRTAGMPRMDAVMYLSGMLERLETMTLADKQALALEVAVKGREGLDINSPQQRYTLRNLPGDFSGLHLLCVLYATLKDLDPKLDPGFDFAQEYKMAQALKRPS